jgi:hypothetical protein
MALVVITVMSACNEGDRLDLATYCPEGLALVIPVEETGDLECLPPPEATQRAITEERMSDADSDTLEYYATREAERDEEMHQELEERRKDNIRSCILAGNQPNLCELDPSDPYGERDQP